jgi:hypothetical protein
VLKERFIVAFVFVFTVALCGHVRVYGQNENVFLHPQKFYKKYFPNLRIKKDLPDSTYIRLYPNYLSASVHVLSPSLRFEMTPRSGLSSGAVLLRTNIADIVGANLNYRYISAGFAFVLKSGMQLNSEYEKSRYRTATIKYNKRGYAFQYKYIRIKGMTDLNTSFPGDNSNVYIKRPDIVLKEFQFESTYNPAWRKYSLMAPFTFSERQIKSAGGFLFKTGLYYSQLSGDSSLVHRSKLAYYSEEFSTINVIRSLSLRLAPGAGANIVLKEKWYGSITAFPSLDIFFYKYLENPVEKVMGSQTLSFTFEGNASVGYQSRRLYAGVRCEVENNNAAMRGFSSKKMYTSLGFEIGYRFNAPRAVQNVYKKTMPPGM